MPIYRIEIDQPLVGDPLAVEGLPCHISAADPGHAISLLRSNIYVNSAGVPLKAVESETPAGTAVDWQTMMLTTEAYADWQAAQVQGDTNLVIED